MVGTIGRRRFILLTLGATAAGGGLTRLDPVAADGSAASHDGADLRLVCRSGHALGTQVGFSAVHADPDVARRAIDAAFAELEQIENVMSLYRGESELCRLNRTGRLDNPHPYLVSVLQSAQSVAKKTGGAFDVTVQPLWEVHEAAKRAGRKADANELAAARRRVGMDQLQVTPERITLAEGAAVTLNGIAQGFATDRVAAVLRDHGVVHALIDAGELSGFGVGQDDEPWQVGIQHPRERDAYIELAQLDNRALATSGDYATTFSEDRRLNHIVDPQTGVSPPELASVTVAAPTAVEADALSTAMFVLGPQRSGNLLQRLSGVDAMLVLKNGRSFSTPGFPSARDT